jgi:protein TonB
MPRRRRNKNPLLVRILVISIVAHAIALPIAAHYGAFQKLQKQFGASTVVVINTPPLEEKKAPEKEKAKPRKQPRTQAKKSSSEVKRPGLAPKTNLSAPKQLAAASGGEGGSGPTVDPNGTGGKAGVLPTDDTKPTAPPSGTGPGTKNVAPPPVKAPVVVPPPINPKLTPPPPPPVVRAKKFVQVETTYAPEPVIPDDLRTEPLDKTTLVEADVTPEGNPENVKVAQSSGIKELDDIGLETAKKYRFKPAILGEDPVEGHVRFRIIFKVE